MAMRRCTKCKKLSREEICPFCGAPSEEQPDVEGDADGAMGVLYGNPPTDPPKED
jgi:hypothetical protein